MRVVLQRVSEASVTINGSLFSKMGHGLLILVGICAEDTAEDVDWLCNKVIQMRIFPDEAGLMNRDIIAIDGEILLISQFTLFAQYKKGNRPSFIKAARPEQAIPLYEAFTTALSTKLGKSVKTGQFGADMQVSLVNDGPVTIIMDSQNRE